MRRTHGSYSSRSRHFLSRGRFPVTRYLKEFKEGEKARIEASPSAKKGRLSHLRYNNRIVEVCAKQGSSYRVRFNDGGKQKFLVVSNVNLRKL